LRDTSSIEGVGPVGDAGDAALEPALVGRLIVLEGGGLEPRRIEILHLVAGDDAAREAADVGEVLGARDIVFSGLRCHQSIERGCDNKHDEMRSHTKNAHDMAFAGWKDEAEAGLVPRLSRVLSGRIMKCGSWKANGRGAFVMVRVLAAVQQNSRPSQPCGEDDGTLDDGPAFLLFMSVSSTEVFP
jgi:hypothetical protein